METDKIRQLWLDETLQEEPIPETSLPRTLQGQGVNLVIRELDANAVGDILNTCTDSKSGKIDQKRLMAMMMIASVRNGDDPDGPPIWNTSFLQPLLGKNVKPLIAIAQQCIKLSGLDVKLDEEKKGSDPTIVEGSLSA